ncbi:hypothetical protein AYI83_01960 [Shewanella algae]|uniref:helix-turn-helix transcriptional regulator n=1 Tax=Shewanella algae TaxID=38313 RepID=UPI001183586D|nr:response regulator transcription factor [Shewanella algae]TVL00248.1 hypothetical protein AYI83_01960 [Shewanella algae]
MFNVMHWLVVSRSALLTELMDSRWPQEFLVRLSCLSPDRWHTDALGTDVDMLLLDLATVEPALGYKILKQATRNRGCKVVLLHYPRRVEYECLLLPSVVKAVFYPEATLAQLSRGLDIVQKGGCDIPFELQSRLAKGELSGDVLTFREREVLQALLAGLSNQQIATSLYVSESTVKTHLYRVFRKLNLSNRAQVMAWAQRHLMADVAESQGSGS